MKFNLASVRDLVDLVNKLSNGLRQLTFEDNMDSFSVQDLEITSGHTVTIRNKLTFIPNKYIITSQIGYGVVTKIDDPSIDKEWDRDFLYLKNNGPNLVTITVIFMR
jgi:hypothetical protein